MGLRFGFIGFGEVASVFSKVLRDHGAGVCATDLLLAQPGGKGVLRARMAAQGIDLVSLRGLVANCNLVFSTVTTQAARQVAEGAVTFLRSGQIYVDLNSTSPAIKVEIGQIIRRSSAEFVEGAVLGAVGATGGQTRILVAGESAQKTADILTEHGLNVTYYSPEVGKASMFKMLRSIFSKGLECLVLELLIAGRRAGIEQDLWNDITDFMAKKPFGTIADNWIRTHASAYERRYHEMVQVVETMQEIGVSPIMTAATTAVFGRSVALKLGEKIQGVEDVRDAVVTALEASDRDTRD